MQRIPSCSQRIKRVFRSNVYQIRETLFDKLVSFGIKYRNEQKLSEKLAMFDFETIFVREETFQDTNTTRWIEKHVRYQNPFPQTLLLNQFSVANLILVTSLRLQVELC